MVNIRLLTTDGARLDWNAIYAGMQPGELADHEVLVDHSGREGGLRGKSTFRARLVVRRKDDVSTVRAQKAYGPHTGRSSERRRIREAHVGEALAGLLVKAGYTVKIANSRGPDSLTTFEQRTSAEAVAIADILLGVDVLMIAIPMARIAELPKTVIATLPPGAIVVDAGNYYPLRDGAIPEINAGLTESQRVSRALGVAVAKAFNNIIASILATGTSRQRQGIEDTGKAARGLSGGATRPGVKNLCGAGQNKAEKLVGLTSPWHDAPSASALTSPRRLG